MRYSGMIDGVPITDDARHRILNPAPGTSLANARDFGIDLTLILRNISLSPEKRLEKAERTMRFAHELRSARRI